MWLESGWCGEGWAGQSRPSEPKTRRARLDITCPAYFHDLHLVLCSTAIAFSQQRPPKANKYDLFGPGRCWEQGAGGATARRPMTGSPWQTSFSGNPLRHRPARVADITISGDWDSPCAKCRCRTTPILGRCVFAACRAAVKPSTALDSVARPTGQGSWIKMELEFIASGTER